MKRTNMFLAPKKQTGGGIQSCDLLYDLSAAQVIIRIFLSPKTIF